MLFYGLSKNAGIRATAIHEKSNGISFNLHLPHEHLTVDLAVPGHFMVLNALAAAAVGQLLGLSAAEIKAGLEHYTVEVKPLDKLLEPTKQQASFIKCDVEGHELSVIRGAKRLIEQREAAWLIEISNDPAEQGSDADQIFKIFDSIFKYSKNSFIFS